ncbi:unnamed protein product [Lepidochelys olivacea]
MRLFPILGWMLFPGCWAVTGPGAVHGPPGGAVAVRCQYQSGSEDDPKFWCQEAGVWEGGSWRCSRGHHIVETNGSEAEVRQGRVSIRDNHTELAFTVTVENLTWADAGTYHCGVGKSGPDPRVAVELTVSPANSSPPSTETSSSATEQPTASSPSISTSLGTNAEKGISTFCPGISTNHDTTASGSQDSDIVYILVPCVLLVLILFLLAAVMLVRLSKKRKKALSGASVQRDKKINLSNLGSEEVSYVTVTISNPDQQPIYANLEQRPKKTRPAKPPEETMYSAVKKPPKH